MAGYVDRQTYKKFIDAVAGEEPKASPVTKVIGTVREVIPPNDSDKPKYEVVLDGSPDGTPIPTSSTLSGTVLNADDRVVVLMSDREATITGNLTKPADETIAENAEEAIEKALDEDVPEIVGQLADTRTQYAIAAEGRQPSESDWSYTFVPPTDSKPVCWIRTVNKEGDVIRAPEVATVNNNPFIFMSKVGKSDGHGNYTLIDGGLIDTDTLKTNTVIVGVQSTATNAKTTADGAKTTADSAKSTADSAKKTATNYITEIDSGGIKMHDTAETNKLEIISSGLQFYVRNSKVGSIQSNEGSLRMAADDGSYYSYLDLSSSYNASEGELEATNGSTYSSIDVWNSSSSGNRMIYLGTSYTIYMSHGGEFYPGLGGGSGTANVIYDGNGALLAKGSTRRIKRDIKPLEDASFIYDIPVVTFKYKEESLRPGDERYGRDVIGLVAEDVDKVSSICVDHDDEGNATIWNTEILVPAMLKAIQDLKAEVNSLKEALSHD